KEKMSKSLGNYIGVDENAKDMYVKIMRIPDELIVTYFELTTDVHPDKIKAIAALLEEGQINPRDIKMQLARDMIKLYHTPEEVLKAEENFKAIYQKKDINIDFPIINYDQSLLGENGESSLIEFIFSTGKYKSKAEIRRLIQQGAVKINGEKTQELFFIPANDLIIQVGKGNVFKLQALDNELEKQKVLGKQHK
ncbi:MAG: S4 domain-containing protein, partial [Bacilli bacterium]|nr:S4 domain-containing protein [Bacilli bacterium]